MDKLLIRTLLIKAGTVSSILHASRRFRDAVIIKSDSETSRFYRKMLPFKLLTDSGSVSAFCLNSHAFSKNPGKSLVNS